MESIEGSGAKENKSQQEGIYYKPTKYKSKHQRMVGNTKVDHTTKQESFGDYTNNRR